MRPLHVAPVEPGLDGLPAVAAILRQILPCVVSVVQMVRYQFEADLHVDVFDDPDVVCRQKRVDGNQTMLVAYVSGPGHDTDSCRAESGDQCQSSITPPLAGELWVHANSSVAEPRGSRHVGKGLGGHREKLCRVSSGGHTSPFDVDFLLFVFSHQCVTKVTPGWGTVTVRRADLVRIVIMATQKKTGLNGGFPRFPLASLMQ